jgi:hypothetical protein
VFGWRFQYIWRIKEDTRFVERKERKERRGEEKREKKDIISLVGILATMEWIASLNRANTGKTSKGTLCCHEPQERDNEEKDCRKLVHVERNVLFICCCVYCLIAMLCCLNEGAYMSMFVGDSSEEEDMEYYIL